jgi:GxxExxY protein
MTKHYIHPEYPHSETTAKIIKAAKIVHRELGPGFREVIYQRALALELSAQDLDFSREVWMDVHYRGQKVGRKRVDFIVEQVMVELKAKAIIEDVDFVQTLSYLKASGYTVALLLNFGAKQLGIKRIVNEGEVNRRRHRAALISLRFFSAVSANSAPSAFQKAGSLTSLNNADFTEIFQRSQRIQRPQRFKDWITDLAEQTTLIALRFFFSGFSAIQRNQRFKRLDH